MSTISKLRAQLAGATARPWRVDPNDVSIHSGDMKVADIRGWGWLQKKPNGAAEMDANAELIASAVNALPKLLAVAEAAGEELAAIEEQFPERGISRREITARRRLARALAALEAP